MKLFIIGSKDSGSKNDSVKLAGELKKLSGVQELSHVYFEDLIFRLSSKAQSVTDSASGVDLGSADLVIALNWYKNGRQSIYRDVAYSLALYLEAKKVPFWNSEMGRQRSVSKLSTLMLLALNGFDMPATTYSLSADLLAHQADGYPLICKAVAASRGADNHLVQNADELKALLGKAGAPNHYLTQEFIPNDSDLRILCFGGEPKMIIERRRKDNSTHLNNTSLGADASLVELSQLGAETIEACRQICKLMGREMAGIDFIRSNDGLSRQVFLEVNAVPQLTSGTYVDDKLKALAQSLSEFEERQAK